MPSDRFISVVTAQSLQPVIFEFIDHALLEPGCVDALRLLVIRGVNGRAHTIYRIRHLQKANVTRAYTESLLRLDPPTLCKA